LPTTIVGMNGFDFFIGSWNVVNRRLTNLLGGDEWETFPATTTCQSIFNGGGNTRRSSSRRLGSRGFTLRLFDVERKEWSIYWSNSQTGLLFPPVVGTFTDGAATSTVTTRMRANRSRPTSSGLTSRPARPGGTGVLRRTVGRRGNPTGYGVHPRMTGQPAADGQKQRPP